MNAQKNPAVDESVSMETELLAESFPSRNKPERLAWFRDAGLGLFIHWSLDVQLGCVISHSLVGASDDYARRYFEELPRTLNPRDWDFDHLAELARLAGFRYAVLTTKHHNGFCLWDTDTTDFGIMNTPYGVDIVAQYVAAFRKQGLAVGLYFSPEDFHYLYEQKQIITRSPLEPYAPAVYDGYRELLKAQITELLTRYGPIDVLFFDGGDHANMWDAASGMNLQRFCLEHSWDLQPDVLITRGAIPTPEQQLPGVGADVAWEGCITLGTAWQYQPTNEVYKTGLHAIRLIVQTRAKGGTLLLNVGPDAGGRLCRAQEDVLREVALWNFINRETLYDVRPWIVTNEDDIWLLRHASEDTVYAVLFGTEGWDRGMRRSFVLRSVRAGADSVVGVLGQSGACTEYRPDLDAHTYWSQEADGLHVDAMNAQRVYCGVQWRNPLVLKITHAAEAFVPMRVSTCHDRLAREGDAATLWAHVGSLGSFERARLRFEYRVYPGFALSSYDQGWESAGDVDVAGTGFVSARVAGLVEGTTYQYRAVLDGGANVMKGEMKLFAAGRD